MCIRDRCVCVCVCVCFSARFFPAISLNNKSATSLYFKKQIIPHPSTMQRYVASVTLNVIFEYRRKKEMCYTTHKLIYQGYKVAMVCEKTSYQE